MYVDSHVHLQPHGAQPPMTRAHINQYVAAGRACGVSAIAITEHLFRFREAFGGSSSGGSATRTPTPAG